jgi:uncharacterized protein YbgA (DUF1722 family)
MSKLLSTAKAFLITQATELYDFRKDSCESLLDYQDHYKNLGEIIWQIENYQSFGDLIKDIEEDNLQVLGYFGADEFMLEDFLKKVIRSL